MGFVVGPQGRSGAVMAMDLEEEPMRLQYMIHQANTYRRMETRKSSHLLVAQVLPPGVAMVEQAVAGRFLSLPKTL